MLKLGRHREWAIGSRLRSLLRLTWSHAQTHRTDEQCTREGASAQNAKPASTVPGTAGVQTNLRKAPRLPCPHRAARTVTTKRHGYSRSSRKYKRGKLWRQVSNLPMRWVRLKTGKLETCRHGIASINTATRDRQSPRQEHPGCYGNCRKGRGILGPSPGMTRRSSGSRCWSAAAGIRCQC